MPNNMLPKIVLLIFMVTSLTGVTHSEAAESRPSYTAAKPPKLIDLQSQTFLSSEVSVNGKTYKLASKKPISIRFMQRDLSINAGCNTLGGSYYLSKGKVITQTLFETKMACTERLFAQDSWLNQLISSKPNIKIQYLKANSKKKAPVKVLTIESLLTPSLKKGKTIIKLNLLETNASPTTRPKLDLYAGVSNPIQSTSRSEEFMIQTSDGRTRTYRFFKPGSIDSKIPAPLVLALHGGLASARQFEANSGLSEFAESNGFYVVYPNGINASETKPGFQTWNAGDCCGPAVRNGVDDVAFMASLIKLIKDSYLIDPTRVFAMGHSNGGMLAYKLACELSDQVKGVGIQSASLGMDNCDSVNPVKLVHIHGTADKNFPIEGGLGSGIAGVQFRSARFALDVFASINKCNKTPEATRDIRNSEITIYEWNKCSTNVGMRYITVEGASHAWMGRTAVSSSAESLVGTPYSNLDSTRAILSFLLGTER